MEAATGFTVLLSFWAISVFFILFRFSVRLASERVDEYTAVFVYTPEHKSEPVFEPDPQIQSKEGAIAR